MRLPHRVIDADGHIDEKHVDWAARVPERFRADAPGGGRSARGRDVSQALRVGGNRDIVKFMISMTALVIATVTSLSLALLAVLLLRPARTK